jgi:hypothetical protein
MPLRNQPPEIEIKEVDFPQLIAAIGGGTPFTHEDMVIQLSKADDENRDFYVNHRNERYKVPAAKAKEFFKEHEKPIRPMSVAEENKLLKRKLEEAEKELAKSKGEKVEKKKPATPPEPEIKGVRKKATKKSSPKDPAPKGEEGPIPSADEKPESFEDIQNRLKSEIKDKQPVSAADEVSAPSKKSPKAPE